MDDVEDAKRVLSGFDMLVDLAYHDCSNMILKIMGVDMEVSHDREARYQGYEKDFNRDGVKLQNFIDVPLYEYARKLTELDCAFYSRSF